MSRPPFSTRTQAYARERVEAYMTASIRILRMTEPTMNTTTLIITRSEYSQVYSGVARIQLVRGAGVLIAGEEEIDTRSTLVTIPWDATVPHVDDIVIVDSFGSDTDLTSRAFVVKSVDGGGLLRAARTLTCVAYTESKWWDA